jgi:hypothetical protein
MASALGEGPKVEYSVFSLALFHRAAQSTMSVRVTWCETPFEVAVTGIE